MGDGMHQSPKELFVISLNTSLTCSDKKLIPEWGRPFWLLPKWPTSVREGSVLVCAQWIPTHLVTNLERLMLGCSGLGNMNVIFISWLCLTQTWNINSKTFREFFFFFQHSPTVILANTAKLWESLQSLNWNMKISNRVAQWFVLSCINSIVWKFVERKFWRSGSAQHGVHSYLISNLWSLLYSWGAWLQYYF